MDRKPKQKKLGGGAKALLAIGIVLLILAGVPFLYLSIGFPYGDPEKLAATVPMPSEKRYAFHASMRTADIAVDESDVGWLVYSESDVSDALDEVAATLAPYGLTLARYGLQFKDGAALVNAKLVWRGFLPIPLQARFTIGNSGAELEADLQDVRLGRLIQLKADTLPLPKEARTFSLDLSEIHSRLKQLKQARVEGDRLILTCGVGREIVAEILANFDSADGDTDYLGELQAVALARALLDEANADYGPLDALLGECETDPARFAAFKISELALAEDYKAHLYLTNADSAMLERFLPEVTQQSVAALAAEYDATCNERTAQLLAVVKNLQSLNESRMLSSNGVQMINLSENGAPLTIEQLSNGAALSDWLDVASVRIVYGEGCSEYMRMRLDRIGDMPKETKDAFFGMRISDIYAPVLILRTATGRPVVAFDPTGAGLVLRALSEEEYAALMQSERVPVVRLEAEMLM